MILSRERFDLPSCSQVRSCVSCAAQTLCRPPLGRPGKSLPAIFGLEAYEMLFGPAVCLSVFQSPASQHFVYFISFSFSFYCIDNNMATHTHSTGSERRRNVARGGPTEDRRGPEKTTCLTFCWNFNKPLSNHRHQGLCFTWPSATFVRVYFIPAQSFYSRTCSASLYALSGEY